MYVIRKRGWEIPERLATPESVYLNRREILKASGFSLMGGLLATALSDRAMAQAQSDGSADLYPAPRNRGWYIVSVRQIVPGTVAANDPLVASARKELAQLSGRELADQLRRAIRAEVGVTRKDSAIKAALAQVSGGN